MIKILALNRGFQGLPI